MGKVKEWFRKKKEQAKNFYHRHETACNVIAITGATALGGYLAYNFVQGVKDGVKEELTPAALPTADELQIEAAQERNDYNESENEKLAKAYHDKLARVKDFADGLGIEPDEAYVIAGSQSDYGSYNDSDELDIYVIKDGYWGYFEDEDEEQTEPTEES